MFEPIAFVTYFAVMSITPGPNNLMLASSGVNFGFRRTLPHMLGVSGGCALQLLIIATLFSAAVAALGTARIWLAAGGCTYLLYLSWQLFRAGAPGAGTSKHRPMSFFGAALFQWVNPKAWLMAINSAILFLPAGTATAAIALAAVAAAVNLPCIAVWAAGGDWLRNGLQNPNSLRVFNRAMASLLAATAIWLLIDEMNLVLAPSA